MKVSFEVLDLSSALDPSVLTVPVLFASSTFFMKRQYKGVSIQVATS